MLAAGIVRFKAAKGRYGLPEQNGARHGYQGGQIEREHFLEGAEGHPGQTPDHRGSRQFDGQETGCQQT